MRLGLTRIWNCLREHRRLVVAGIAVLVLVSAFLGLGSEVSETETDAFDRRVLLAFRTDAGEPVGPTWLASAMVNLSALGSAAVAVLVLAFAAIFLLVARRPAHAALLTLCGLGASAVTAGFKALHHRPRPSVGSRLVEIDGYSFPSGHATVATAMYLTLGAVIATSLARRSLRLCVLILAGVLALLVGTTRVYIGVHYPTDVVGGWLVGGAWAVLCGTVARALHDRGLRRVLS